MFFEILKSSFGQYVGDTPSSDPSHRRRRTKNPTNSILNGSGHCFDSNQLRNECHLWALETTDQICYPILAANCFPSKKLLPKNKCLFSHRKTLESPDSKDRLHVLPRIVAGCVTHFVKTSQFMVI